MKTSWLTRVAWTLAVLALALLFAKGFVLDVYHVDTASMEPTILGREGGGESVLVRYDRSPPKRFETLVVQRPGEEAALVKRVAGLEREAVQIVEGDLFIDGKRLAPDVPRPAPTPVFDQRWQTIEQAFRGLESANSPWKRAADVLELDAHAIPENASEGLLVYKQQVTDGYLTREHVLVEGENSANDLVIECEFAAHQPEGRVRLGLSEAADSFEACLAPRADGAQIVLTRNHGTETRETLATQKIALRSSTGDSASSWHALRFANIDNALSLWLDGALVLRATYAENTFHPSDVLHEGKSFPPRAWLGGEGGRWSFRSIRLACDIYYTQRGSQGTAHPLQLGPGQCFVLGDNSAESRDSREWGPLEYAEIRGRARWIVWPLSHLRQIPGAVYDTSP